MRLLLLPELQWSVRPRQVRQVLQELLLPELQWSVRPRQLRQVLQVLQELLLLLVPQLQLQFQWGRQSQPTQRSSSVRPN